MRQIAYALLILLLFAAPPACSPSPTLPDPAKIQEANGLEAKYEVALIQYGKLLIRALEVAEEPGTPEFVIDALTVATERVAEAREHADSVIYGTCVPDVPCPEGEAALRAFERSLLLFRDALLGRQEAQIPSWLLLLLFNIVISELRTRRRVSDGDMSFLVELEGRLIEESRPTTEEERDDLRALLRRHEEALARIAQGEEGSDAGETPAPGA